MTIHSALAMQTLQRFASDSPYFFAGDYNIEPDSGSYKLYYEGKLDSKHPQHPPPNEGDDWKVDLVEPVKSAYKEFDGQEPVFTNHAHLFDNGFTGTLDYIWFSPKKISVVGALKLPTLEDLGNVPALPSKTEPSDHLMIGADFVIKSTDPDEKSE
eukprot:TRINITY_DN2767_c0_g1_i2.p2 TRINITY_DN2767_c0_g1~~TRINITY_DN2767_c0_g1_i2.p2  ORF type:complete len:156 (+),score=49.48 TRINITY_DN2767_c0_g1_i2:781-1248(+)